MMKDEKRYTRVSEILSPYSDFSNIDPQVLANAADRGTRVHKLCELYIKNLMIEPVESLDTELQGYFKSFVNWCDLALHTPIDAEARYYCDELKITGQIDLVAMLNDSNKAVIIDIKTPQNSSKTWNLQTAAYMYLYNQTLDIPIHRRGCLLLNKNGGLATFIEYTDFEREFELFKQAINLYNFFNRRTL